MTNDYQSIMQKLAGHISKKFSTRDNNNDNTQLTVPSLMLVSNNVLMPASNSLHET